MRRILAIAAAFLLAVTTLAVAQSIKASFRGNIGPTPARYLTDDSGNKLIDDRGNYLTE